MRKGGTPDWNLSGLRPGAIAALEAGEKVFFCESLNIAGDGETLSWTKFYQAWMRPIPHDIIPNLSKYFLEKIVALDDPSLTLEQRRDRDHFLKLGDKQFQTLKEMANPGEERTLAAISPSKATRGISRLSGLRDR